MEAMNFTGIRGLNIAAGPGELSNERSPAAKTGRYSWR